MILYCLFFQRMVLTEVGKRVWYSFLVKLPEYRNKTSQKLYSLYPQLPVNYDVREIMTSGVIIS